MTDKMTSKASAKTTAPQRTAKRSAPQRSGSALTTNAVSLQSALVDPLSASPEQIVALQRTYGNRAVQRLIQRAEAEKTQRDSEVGLEGGAVDGDLQNQIQSVRGGGQPLDKMVGSKIGGALGADFSGVRVHTDPKSDTLNRSLGAKAFTLGSDVFFSQGAYDPGTHSGKELLAHELTHVVQQGGAGANNVQTKLTVGPAGDKYEQEADQVAKQVMKMPATTAVAAGDPTSDDKTVQRHAGSHLPSGGGQLDEEDGHLQRQTVSAAPQISIHTATPGAAIQREIMADWVTESTVKGKLGIKKPRSKLLKAVDRAVAAFRGITAPGMRRQRIAAADTVYRAIETWQASKGDRVSIRQAKIQELVDAIHLRVQPDIDFVTPIDQRFANFSTLNPEMSPYAKKTPDIGVDRFQDMTAGGMLDLLSRPRTGDDGSLTGEVMDAIVTNDQTTGLQDNLDIAQVGAINTEGPLRPEEVREIMEAHLNRITEETEYPELENLVAPNTEENVERQEARNVAGVTVTVHYNPSDSMFAARWGLVTAALGQVAAAGFTVPAFTLYLPKYGRQITITGTEGHVHTVTIGQDSAQAQFVARNNLYISSRTYHNPKVDTGLSAQLDPSGIATLVHEIGHYLHFHNNPNKFLQLNFSILAGEVPGTAGKRLADYAREVVSKYGSANPREFTAEVFLGLCYNKAFPDYVLKVYKALGGPIPAGQEDRFDNLTDDSAVPEPEEEEVH